MLDFESINEKLVQILAGQSQLLGLLSKSHVSVEQLDELLLQVRKIEHLTELSTATILNQLRQENAYNPQSRSSTNKRIHQGRFARSQLRQATKLAEELFPQPPTGSCPEPRPARLPHTAAGVQAAKFGFASVIEVSRCLDQVPVDTPEETVAWVEERMAGFAEILAPEDLRKAGLKILQGLNADSEPSDKERQRQRNLRLSDQQADLMSNVSIKATPELDALLRRLLADYAGPGDLTSGVDKQDDPRAAGQRAHDALVAALKHALHREGPMPPTRGCSTVVASMSLEQLHVAAGVVPTDVGTMLPIRDLLRLGADRNAFLAILDPDTGNLIELGKTKRAADVYAYLGLLAAQGGDMTPGSDLPAARCEIHHIEAWRFGGQTVPNNLMLVGHKVHRNIDNTRTNRKKWWTFCTMSGQMLWRPPDIIDPERRPQANFNPTTWFSPGQLMRFGLHTPAPEPPFQRPLCVRCQQAA
ncbi:DUF222 domain-containing protein [Corynebacterium epidermidicanis]|uniref:DUF222 domain-containing protein n=1 Tax=Corynebacterium epidermidicanis TaxID=1050174 RepID=A0A0G3GSU0_9CORY|nr:DUF222 domain-containing protein [Corynebacterium epidermidicanis]AKK04241.1 protein of unknown function DUF222 [Corynebacterium epidermidicanis]